MSYIKSSDSEDSLTDCEVFTGQRARWFRPPLAFLRRCSSSAPSTDSSTTLDIPYESDCTLEPHSPSSPLEISTVRYVGGSSVSISEINSTTETNTITLRCVSPMSMNTEEAISKIETVSIAPSEIELKTEPSQCTIYFPNTSDSQEFIDPTADLCESQTGNNTLSTGSLTDSICESTESDNLEVGVPPLELSERSETSSLGYEQQLNEWRHQRRSSEAYENWLSAKRRQRFYRLQAAREEEERQEQEKIERRQMAQQRYRLWCAQKADQATTSSAKISKQPSKALVSIAKSYKPSKSNQKVAVCNKEAQQALLSWEMRKVKEAQLRQEKQQQQVAQKQLQKKQRQLQSQEAWQAWIKNVNQRPKPVPLNQGIYSLRGTVSNIYINPNNWQAK